MIKTDTLNDSNTYEDKYLDWYQEIDDVIGKNQKKIPGLNSFKIDWNISVEWGISWGWGWSIKSAGSILIWGNTSYEIDTWVNYQNIEFFFNYDGQNGWLWYGILFQNWNNIWFPCWFMTWASNNAVTIRDTWWDVKSRYKALKNGTKIILEVIFFSDSTTVDLFWKAS